MREALSRPRLAVQFINHKLRQWGSAVDSLIDTRVPPPVWAKPGARTVNTLVQSKTIRSAHSIRLVLIPTLGAMALLLLTTIGYVSLGAWTAHRAAVDQMEFDGGANRLIAGLFEILMERLATNNGLQDAEPADSGVLAEIERRRKAVRENFTFGLAMIEQRDFPDKQSLLGQLKTVMKKANDYRTRADASLKLARDNRDQELRTNYIPVITDQVN